jgi:hypothetical protein
MFVCFFATGDKLVVQLREVFEPIGYNINEGWPPHRKVVKISIPGETSLFSFLLDSSAKGSGFAARQGQEFSSLYEMPELLRAGDSHVLRMRR